MSTESIRSANQEEVVSNREEKISNPEENSSNNDVEKISLPSTAESQSLASKNQVLLESTRLDSGDPADKMRSKSQQVTVENNELVEVRPSFVEADRQRSGGDDGETVEKDEAAEDVPVVESEPPFKKNRRVQVPSKDITTGISSIEPSPKMPPKKKFHDPTPQKIGVLKGTPCNRRFSKIVSNESQQLDILKHLTVVFLFSRLKNPAKWEPSTFEEIRTLGDSIDSAELVKKFPIDHSDLTYLMTLTGTLVKGRVNSADAPPPTLKNALVTHVSGYSGLVLKCEAHYLMIWKIVEGYYLYDPCMSETSQLMFFNSLKLMMEFLAETKQFTPRAKFYLSKISLSAVDDGHVVSLKRKSRIPKRFEILNSKEALLMGDRFLKEASFKLESLRVCLNAVYLAQDLAARSWDASNLNQLFEGAMSDKEINKLGVFLCEEGPEECFLLEKVRMIRLDISFGYTEREEFEWLINRVLAIRNALIFKVEENYFSTWSADGILYWFSPFRYDALELDPNELEDKACFLFAFSSLAQFSHRMFEYLTEIRLLPKHSIKVFTVDTEPFGRLPRIPQVNSSDSLNRSELEIRVPEGARMVKYISDEDLPMTTLSEAKLCRIMLQEVVENAEKKYDQ